MLRLTTSHFRLVYDLFLHSFNIIDNISHSWKTIVFDKFWWTRLKKFDLNFNSIEMIYFTIDNAKNEILHMKSDHFSTWKKIFTEVNKERHRLVVFTSRIRFRLLCWSRQITKRSKNNVSWQKSIEISIKKYFFISTDRWLIIETIILRKKIMLRFRSQYEYVILSYLHDHTFIELNNSTSLIESSISRINSTEMIILRRLANEIENEQKISDENFINEFSTSSCRSRHKYD
jgi:hypothetical protein